MKFTDIVALKCNESYCNSSLGQREKKGPRAKPQNIVGITILRKTSF